MSMELMVRAMNLKVGNSARKLVLLKLADNANDKGECWPSHQHIADHTEMGRSTVKGHIKALEQAGFLVKEARNDGRSSNKYILTLEQGNETPRQILTRSNADPVKSEPGQEIATTRSDTDPVTRSGADPRTSHSTEPVSEPVKPTTTLASGFVDRDGVSLDENWNPSEVLLQRLSQLGVPEAFSHSLVAEFRVYWLTENRTPDRGRTWDAAFLNRARSEWEKSKAKLAAMANAPSWDWADQDFSSWHALESGEFKIDADHLQGWLDQCRVRRMAVSTKTIEHFAGHLAEAERLTAMPVSLLVEEVFACGWSRFEAVWLVNKFGLCAAEKQRLEKGAARAA